MRAARQMGAAPMDNPRIDNDNFTASRECFTEVLGWLQGPDAAALSHAELEDQLDARGRELLRRMFQDHLSLRAMTERRLAGVRDDQAHTHGAVEAGHRRPLATVFGEVEVTRLAYRRRGQANLYPADAALNLPTEHHSYGLRRLAAAEASRGSFDEAAAALVRATGQHLGNARSRRLPPGPRPTSRRSMTPEFAKSKQGPRATCWSCPPMARAS